LLNVATPFTATTEVVPDSVPAEDVTATVAALEVTTVFVAVRTFTVNVGITWPLTLFVGCVPNPTLVAGAAVAVPTAPRSVPSCAVPALAAAVDAQPARIQSIAAWW
jgi:hypothetical protein